MSMFAVKNMIRQKKERTRVGSALAVRGFRLVFPLFLSLGLFSVQAASSGGAAIHSHVTLRYGDGFHSHASIDVMVATRAALPTLKSNRLQHTAFRNEAVDFHYRIINQSNGLSQFRLRYSETHIDMESEAQIALLDEHNAPLENLILPAAFTNRVSMANAVAIPAGSERGFVVASETNPGSTVEIGQAEYRVIGMTPGSAAATNANGEPVAEVPSVLELAPLNNHPPITAGSLPAGTHIRAFQPLILRVKAATPSIPGKTGYHRVALVGTTSGVAVLADGENGAPLNFIADDNLHAQVEVPSPVSQLVKRVRNVTRDQSEFVVSTRANVNAYAAPGDELEFEIQINAVAGDLLGVVLSDNLSSFVQYQAGTLTLNGQAVDEEDAGPPLFSEPAGWQVHSPRAEPGVIRDQQSAIVRYRVKVNIDSEQRRSQ